jgi:hypothetical protein
VEVDYKYDIFQMAEAVADEQRLAQEEDEEPDEMAKRPMKNISELFEVDSKDTLDEISIQIPKRKRSCEDKEQIAQGGETQNVKMSVNIVEDDSKSSPILETESVIAPRKLETVDDDDSRGDGAPRADGDSPQFPEAGNVMAAMKPETVDEDDSRNMARAEPVPVMHGHSHSGDSPKMARSHETSLTLFEAENETAPGKLKAGSAYDSIQMAGADEEDSTKMVRTEASEDVTAQMVVNDDSPKFASADAKKEVESKASKPANEDTTQKHTTIKETGNKGSEDDLDPDYIELETFFENDTTEPIDPECQTESKGELDLGVVYKILKICIDPKHAATGVILIAILLNLTDAFSDYSLAFYLTQTGFVFGAALILVIDYAVFVVSLSHYLMDRLATETWGTLLLTSLLLTLLHPVTPALSGLSWLVAKVRGLPQHKHHYLTKMSTVIQGCSEAPFQFVLTSWLILTHQLDAPWQKSTEICDRRGNCLNLGAFLSVGSLALSWTSLLTASLAAFQSSDLLPTISLILPNLIFRLGSTILLVTFTEVRIKQK